METKSFQVVISEEVYKELMELGYLFHLTLEDLGRSAIRLMKLALDAKKDQCSIGIIKGSKVIKEISLP